MKEDTMKNRFSLLALLVPALLLLAGCPDSLLAPSAAITFAGEAPAPAPAPADGGTLDGGAAPAPGGACTIVSAPIMGHVGEAVAITGVCSSDPQGLGIAYDWAVVDAPAGSTADIADASRVTPSFAPDMPGSYRLRLVVSNGTLTSEPMDVDIEVDDCGIRAPSVDSVAASPTEAPAVGQAVQLSASISDPDTAAGCEAHGPEYTYAWSYDALPAGSAATLNDAGAMMPSFVPDVPGVYTVRLTATDPTGRTASASLDITASDCGTNAPTATAAAAPTSVHPGEGVQLQGAGADADTEAACGLSQTLSYAWHFAELPAGSAASIVSPHAERPSFTPDVPGTYIAALIVMDDTGLRSDASTVSITVDDCGQAAPIAVASKMAPGGVALCDGTVTSVNLGGNAEVQFDGTASSDPDNGGTCGMSQTLHYRWEVMSTPLRGGDSRFRNPDASQPVLNIQRDGLYEIRLIVTDETGRESRPVTCRVETLNRG